MALRDGTFFVATLALEGDGSERVFATSSFFDRFAGTAEAIEVLFERGSPRMAGEEPGPLVGIWMVGLLESSPSDPTKYCETTGTG